MPVNISVPSIPRYAGKGTYVHGSTCNAPWPDTGTYDIVCTAQGRAGGLHAHEKLLAQRGGQRVQDLSLVEVLPVGELLREVVPVMQNTSLTLKTTRAPAPLLQILPIIHNTIVARANVVVFWRKYRIVGAVPSI